MLTDFKKHIETNFTNLFGNKFLLACSGGVDSMVLVDLCRQCNLDFVIAHCNFRLRGAASDGDEALVKEVGKSVGKKILVTHFDTIGYINKNKVSLQIAARDLRYRWFAELMEEKAINTLVTAHHADDNLETFIINLSRGTGIAGLTGIPSKTDSISRPLLPFSREEILAYARNRNLSWREDSSNADTKYLRNKIRHEIVPRLKELHPNFLNNFELTRTHLSDTANLLEDYAARLKNELFDNHNGIIRVALERLLPLKPRKAYLHALFSEFGFNAWDDISNLMTAMSGKEVLSKTHRLVKDRDHLLLTEIRPISKEVYVIGANDVDLINPIDMRITEVEALGEIGPKILYVDKETLKYPLTVRKWNEGDYFYPLGMQGKKKLAKFFKDEKIDVIAKHNQWLLCSGDDIVWVIGKRPDNRFKVTERTKNIIKIIVN
ncbi:tRNA lysidine(34) synthetase TilS [uncultured Kriegella sp.]|uniref:tRNA lysidine(34) synthetase TilS n=1 Tax=uncultured Kriegella sp. TaxID=1798910 RepID=UPI0030DC6F26|tara:strand:+ start:309793 stop:311097 length:1305 start_codon:yes stop_codon:yes gene_type:complete